MPSRFIPALEALGDSVLVVGDSTTLKVHVHTDEPEQATAVFRRRGGLAPRRRRHARAGGRARRPLAGQRRLGNGDGERRADGAARAAPPGRARCGALAVVNGEGLSALFQSLGVDAIDGGPTLNPSTYELLAGDPRGGGRGGDRAAQQRERDHGRRARRRAVREAGPGRPVHAASRPASSAAVALRPDGDVAENAAAMTDALSLVRTGAVAAAARDDAQGRFHRGEAIGFVEEEVVAWGAPERTLEQVLEHLAVDAELISCIAGRGAPLDAGAVRGAAARRGRARVPQRRPAELLVAARGRVARCERPGDALRGVGHDLSVRWLAPPPQVMPQALGLAPTLPLPGPMRRRRRA